MARNKFRPEGFRAFPEKILLPVKDPLRPSPLPAVRIFIGSEAAQYRAERILVWSIEQVRDPNRAYVIFLMKELSGFDRRKWLTGFTNYRFAIPALAGGRGRAIYNDVDQIYLTDPAELFDHDMKDHGFLSIAQNDSSVMLMDCAKMANIWTLNAAQVEKKNKLLQRALDGLNLWGPLEPEWNARDEEYRPGHSKILHYTALHTQPWHPFPEQFVYQDSPEGTVWFTLEEKANQAGYQLFTRSQPSSQFRELMNKAALGPTDSLPSPTSIQEVKTLANLDEHITTQDAKTCLWCRLGQDKDPLVIEGLAGVTQASLSLIPYDLCRQTPDALPAKDFDIVYSAGDLQWIPDEDIPWVLDEMFALARSLVFVEIQTEKRGPSMTVKSHSSGLQRTFEWWISHFQTTSRRYPKIHWKFVLKQCQTDGVERQLVRCGGYWATQPPRIWILSDGKVGHTTQSEILAKSLSWPYEIKHLRFHGWHKIQKLLWGLFPPNTFGLDRAHSSPLGPPWPDLVISTGWRPAPIARWICEQSQGKTRVIQLGRKGGGPADLFDVVITPTYYGFPPHSHRIQTLAPLNGLTPESLETVSLRWPHLFGDAPHPRIVFVVGGSTARFKFTPNMARSIGNRLKELAQKCHGKIFAVTSPRTGKDLSQALESTLAPDHFVHKWQPNQSDNPYLAYLAGADVIIVTGESESMLTEAASLGKPVYIIPLPENPPSWKIKLSEWIIQKAHSRPLNKRGTVRPQQGLERFCSRLLRGGLVQPRRDLNLLHESLIQRGIARRFGEPLETGTRPRLYEPEVIIRQIQDKLGICDYA